MTTARSKQVDASVTRWYHCISRCVRRAFLLGEGDDSTGGNRKIWIENRLKELADIFAISVGGFAVMDNHLHVLARLDPATAKAWSDEQVVVRWWKLYPPRDARRKQLAITPELIEQKLQDATWVTEIRERLESLSWFMKCLKEPLARMVNQAEECTGAFWASRYKSIAILDEEALLSVCAYIDLNPVAAAIALVPEEGPHTSIKQRVDHVRSQDRVPDLAQALAGSIEGSRSASSLEESLWLVPIENRRGLDSQREGMVEGFTLGNYLLLVDYTGRLLREEKASISADLASVFQRLGNTADAWQQRLEQLCRGRLLGRFLSTSRERLRETAAKLGVHHLANLGGCAAA